MIISQLLKLDKPSVWKDELMNTFDWLAGFMMVSSDSSTLTVIIDDGW